MRALIESIFGVYQPITYQVWHQLINPDGSVSWQLMDDIAPGFAGVDWTYVLGVIGFFLMIYCAMRILGGILSAK